MQMVYIQNVQKLIGILTMTMIPELVPNSNS